METLVKDRVKEFLFYLGVGQNKFEKQIGFSNGYINNVKVMGSDKLAKIMIEYPQLNIEWLLIGKGQMIKEQKKITGNIGSNIVSGDNNDVTNESRNKINESETLSCKELLEIIRKKDEQIANKDTQINNLLELLKKQ